LDGARKPIILDSLNAFDQSVKHLDNLLHRYATGRAVAEYIATRPLWERYWFAVALDVRVAQSMGITVGHQSDTSPPLKDAKSIARLVISLRHPDYRPVFSEIRQLRYAFGFCIGKLKTLGSLKHDDDRTASLTLWREWMADIRTHAASILDKRYASDVDRIFSIPSIKAVPRESSEKASNVYFPPNLRDRYVYIDGVEKLAKFIQQQPPHQSGWVSLDAEWTPDLIPAPYAARTLQLAFRPSSNHHVAVIDLWALCKSDEGAASLMGYLDALFRNDACVKIGYGFAMHDIARIVACHPSFRHIESVMANAYVLY
jgi:hypothetical protein